MIREWLHTDGTIAQYDTATKTIQYLDAGTRQNVVIPHPATTDERAAYRAAYPEMTQEEQSKQAAMVLSLQTARQAINAINDDTNATLRDLRDIFDIYTNAMRDYRQYDGPDSFEVERLVNIVTGIIVRTTQRVVADLMKGLDLTISQNSFLQLETDAANVRLDAIEARLAQAQIP
jgi:hypothetical protein